MVLFRFGTLPVEPIRLATIASASAARAGRQNLDLNGIALRLRRAQLVCPAVSNARRGRCCRRLGCNILAWGRPRAVGFGGDVLLGPILLVAVSLVPLVPNGAVVEVAVIGVERSARYTYGVRVR